MVLASPIQGSAAHIGDFHQLGTGFRRVLSGGARQQIWQRSIFTRTAQNYSGSHYTVGFRDLFGRVPQESTDLGSSFRLLADRYRRFFRLSSASITAKMSRRFNSLSFDALNVFPCSDWQRPT